MAHIASNVSFSPDPRVVIPETITGALSILKSVSRQPSVKRVVYTSSAIATGFGKPNTPYSVPADSWNDLSSKLAWAPPPYEDGRKYAVYAASKTEAEKACWKFVEEEKPQFEFSTVLPSVTFGASLHESQSSETLTWIQALLNGDSAIIKRTGTAPCESCLPIIVPDLRTYMRFLTYYVHILDWFVDVTDVARLHAAALINPSVKSERIFAYSEPYNWSAILDILRKAYPEHLWPENIPEEPRNLSTIEKRERSVELLKDLGRDGYVSLEESIRSNAAQIL